MSGPLLCDGAFATRPAGRSATWPRRLPVVDRRPLIVLLVLGLSGAVAPAAGARSADALLAQSGSGTLSDSPTSDLIAQTPRGKLSGTPTTVGTKAKSSASSSASGTTATASALPFTGSDPRVMLGLGLAAILAGAGLRLRTGDARDY